MHTKKIIHGGKPLQEAKKALIMLHGRGGSAEDILSLADHLNVNEYALLAPQATNNSWYPLSFMASRSQNDPWLSSALSILKQVVTDIKEAGIGEDHIYFTGFSQGACLTLEFVAQNPANYGGIAAFTGGLIGPEVDENFYKGQFNQTPVFIGSSDPDPHVPVQRVHESSKIFRSMGANVKEVIYPNMGHTISREEIEIVNNFIFS